MKKLMIGLCLALCLALLPAQALEGAGAVGLTAAVESSAVEQDLTNDAPVDAAAVEQGLTDDAASEASAGEQGLTDDAASEASAVEQGLTDDAAVESSAVEQGLTDDAAVEADAGDQSLTDDAPVETTAGEQGLTDDAAFEASAGEQGLTDDAAFEASAGEQSLTNDAALQAVSAVSEEQIPTGTGSGDAADEWEPTKPAEDSGDLLLSYLEQQAGVLPELMSKAGDRLTGVDAVIYQQMKTAVQEVAAGTRRSTEVVFTPETLPEFTWSLSGGSDDEAMAAEIINAVSFGSIMNALSADCPYDLYWYGYSSSYPYQYRYWEHPGNLEVELTQFSMRISVSRYFRDGNDEYRVRSGLGSLLSTVQSTASSIVASNAGKTDYEKLKAYKEAICDLVSYNSAAAREEDGFSSKNNSNPWQLLYVFDNDTTTNVVCEGYAKAFQYLCDLSSFQTSDFACYRVSGLIGERHAWNHVTLDGRTYLVDLTNCDTGTRGYPDGLFMRPALAGSNTQATGYVIPLTSAAGGGTFSYWDIDFCQSDPTESMFDANAPFLTLATEEYAGGGGQPVTMYTVTVTGGYLLPSGFSTGEFAEGETVTIDADPAPAGTTLWGWRRVSGLSTPVQYDTSVSTLKASFTMPGNNVELVAYYRAAVTLDAGGGTVSPGSFDVRIYTDGGAYDTYGAFLTLPTPVRTDFVFDGWYTAAEGGTKVTDGTSVTAAGPHTLYAHWTATEHTVKIIGGYILPGTSSTGEFAEGETVTIAASAAPAGCSLWGWRKTQGLTQNLAFAEDTQILQASFTMPENDVEIVAYYRTPVTLNAAGGAVTPASVDVRTYADGNAYSTYGASGGLPTPVRNGYHFEGWYTAETGGMRVREESSVTAAGPHTLYAHWSVAAVSVDSVSRSGGTVQASVAGGEGAFVCCAVYGAGGQMTGFQSRKIEAASSSYTFSFPDASFASAQVFVMDSLWRPLCARKSA